MEIITANGIIISQNFVHMEFPEGIYDDSKTWWAQHKDIHHRLEKHIKDCTGYDVKVVSLTSKGGTIMFLPKLVDLHFLSEAVGSFQITPEESNESN